jgi:hypothetical protein
MRRRQHETALTLCAGVGLVALLALAQLRRSDNPPSPGPRTLRDARPIVEGLGLYCRSDRPDGCLDNRLVVSERPLTADRANFLRLSNPQHPCWLGTVALCSPARAYAFHLAPEGTAIWGGLFVIGDPALVRKLVGPGG